MRQIITLTNGSVVGIDAANGASLWSIPFQDDWHENIVSPLWTGGALIVSGPRQGTHAYSIARAGHTWQSKQLWKNADVTMYTVAPVFADGIIYGMSNKRRGQFVAVRASDGSLKWSTTGRDGNHASILQHGDQLLFLTDGGVLIVARRTADGVHRGAPLRDQPEPDVVDAGAVAGRHAGARSGWRRETSLGIVRAA